MGERPRSAMRDTGERAGAPTICVGNFVAGGAGKTPAALALARMLIGEGRRVAFLSRGYGGAERASPCSSTPGPTPRRWSATSRCCSPSSRRAGSEPIACRSARSAVEAGANALMLDDGLQNPALAKDLAFAVVDGETGFGNGLCVPAGPLRAPLGARRRWCRR